MHLYNGLSRDEISDFIRDALNKARRLGISIQTVIDLCAHYGLELTLTRATLQKFIAGDTDHIGNDDNATTLYQFFTTCDLGRAVVSFEKRDTHPYRLLIDSLLKSSNATPPADLTGMFFGYHPALSNLDPTKSWYSVRAFQIQRGHDGLIWFEDYLAEDKGNDDPPEIFHNKGLVVFVAEKPQFISIDLKTGRNLRFFIPSDLYMPDLTVTHMTGPMTSWTRANRPANRYQRLVRTSEPDYEVLKKQTCMRELSDLPKKHQKECKALSEIEKQAVTALESAIKSKPHEGNGSSTVLPVGG